MRLKLPTLPKIDVATLRANAPSVVTGILVLALTVTGVQLGRSAIGWWQQTQTKGPATLPTVTAAATPGFDASAIANAHLFGGGLPPPSLDSSVAPTLVLVGTVAFPDPNLGLAILGESREQTALFRVGSQVPGGGQIKAVFADRISIERNGMLTTLKLPRSSLVEMGLATATLPTGTNKEMIGSVFLFTAVLEDDRFIAAKVYPGQDATAFKALGLRPGDEIKEVNREEYSDPVGILTSLAYLQPGETMEITVLRKDAFLHLALEGSSVARIRSELLRAERVVSKSKNIPPDKTP